MIHRFPCMLNLIKESQRMSSSLSSLIVSREYYCYQCDRIVSNIVCSPELICPLCRGGFLEDLDAAAAAAPPNPHPSHLHHHNNPSNNNNININIHFNNNNVYNPLPLDNFPMIFSPGSGGSNSPRELGLLSGLRPAPGVPRGRNEFNPFIFLRNYLNTLRAGGEIQLVFETSGAGGGDAVAVGGGGPGGQNLRDYFIGAGLEQLIQQLAAENEHQRRGAPPAAKSAVEGLPNVKITEELLASDSWLCAVCKDSFEVNEEAKRMPCKHMYHKDCIFPWLDLHNTCPVCRYELPTDDPDYECRGRRRRNGDSSTSGGNESSLVIPGNAGNLLTPRTLERRFRISLPPWLFTFRSSTAESSNGGGGTGNSNGEGDNGGRNGGGGGSNLVSREGARQEDLD